MNNVADQMVKDFKDNGYNAEDAIKLACLVRFDSKSLHKLLVGCDNTDIAPLIKKVNNVLDGKVDKVAKVQNRVPLSTLKSEPMELESLSFKAPS